jgi:hypothetical protein
MSFEGRHIKQATKRKTQRWDKDPDFFPENTGKCSKSKIISLQNSSLTTILGLAFE